MSPDSVGSEPSARSEPASSSIWTGPLGRWGAAILIVTAIVAVLAYFAVSTRETRRAVRTYSRLTGAVNSQDLETVRQLCSRRYLDVHKLRKAAEGGVVGFPRSIHKNFQAWREGEAVWLCPTNRIGPVYQFVDEDGQWKYDGVVGLLRSGGQLLLLSEEARQSEESNDLIVP